MREPWVDLTLFAYRAAHAPGAEAVALAAFHDQIQVAEIHLVDLEVSPEILIQRRVLGGGDDNIGALHGIRTLAETASRHGRKILAFAAQVEPDVLVDIAQRIRVGLIGAGHGPHTQSIHDEPLARLADGEVVADETLTVKGPADVGT